MQVGHDELHVVTCKSRVEPDGGAQVIDENAIGQVCAQVHREIDRVGNLPWYVERPPLDALAAAARAARHEEGTSQ